jgi:hypothetical protein
MFRRLPPAGSNNPRAVAEILNGAMDGKTNNTGTVTLATGNVRTTTITDARISPDSVILLMPSSASAIADTAPYGAFQDSTDQTAASTTVAYPMTFNTTDFSNGVYLSDSSRMNVRNAGIYNLQFSVQLENTDSAQHDVDIWFRKNGTNLTASNSKFTVPARKSASIFGHVIGAINYFVELAANDYVEIVWRTESTSVSLEQTPAESSPTRPATPSVIATMQYVAPNSMDNVYISAQTKGSATLTHFSNNTSGKTYKYVVVG